MNYRSVKYLYLVTLSVPYRPGGRLSGYGFLAGKEVKDAGLGSLGLQDRESITH